MESKNDKFRRLSEARLEKSLDAIRLLSNLVSANYESSEEERQSIVDRLNVATGEVATAYGIGVPEAPPLPEVIGKPTKEADLHLIHIGPPLGKAFEALTLDNNPEECANILKELLKA